jgi:hypothetical protein
VASRYRLRPSVWAELGSRIWWLCTWKGGACAAGPGSAVRKARSAARPREAVGPGPPLRPPEPAGAGAEEGPWAGSMPRSCPASPSRPCPRPRSPSTGSWTSRRRSRAPGPRPSRTASRVSGSRGVAPACLPAVGPQSRTPRPRCGSCWPQVSARALVLAPGPWLQSQEHSPRSPIARRLPPWRPRSEPCKSPVPEPRGKRLRNTKDFVYKKFTVSKQPESGMVDPVFYRGANRNSECITFSRWGTVCTGQSPKRICAPRVPNCSPFCSTRSFRWTEITLSRIIRLLVSLRLRESGALFVCSNRHWGKPLDES